MKNEIGMVYKYFDLIDGFIRVRIIDRVDWPGDQQPDRRAYRRLVIDACVIGLKDQVLTRVRQIYPEDAAAADDLLYQICVDVNPRLEIHTVALTAGDEEAVLAPDTTGRAKGVRGLEKALGREIVGQGEAISRICRALRTAACGLHDPGRPVGSFLLVGRTGCGKTAMAKALAACWEVPLVRVDCSEYALPHETAKLTGAPPGYVGYHEGGALTEALLHSPDAVVLFDEVEKGHEKLHNLLLQILDEGRLTDNKGNTVSLCRCVILMTSNVGTEDYAEAATRMGFERRGPLPAGEYGALTGEALRRTFKPELLNRLDGVLVFNQLTLGDAVRIATLQLRQVAARAWRAGIDLRWSRGLPPELGRLGYSEEFGARAVRRTVDRLVREPLTSGVLEGRFRAGDAVRAQWQGEVTLGLARPRKRPASVRAAARRAPPSTGTPGREQSLGSP